MASTSVQSRNGVRMISARPARKVAVGAVAGAITTALVWFLNSYILHGPQIPTEVAAALVVIVTAVISYIVPPSANDEVVAQ